MNKPKQPLTPAQAMNRAAALCAHSEQAAGDIREKLFKWGLSGSDVTRIINQLTEQGFLNEARFARAFVKDRFAFNGWGKIKIAHQLKQKGISTDVVDEAMNAIDDDAWAAMMRFAASRGFETSLSSECVNQVTRIDVEDD